MHPSIYQVTTWLTVGPHPAAHGRSNDTRVASFLGAYRPTVVVDLTSPAEGHGDYVDQLLPTARRVSFPIADYGVPSAAQLAAVLDTLDGAQQHREPVYLHCAAGVGRSGLVVTAYLMRAGLSLNGALEHVRTLRAHTEHPAAVPESPLQAAFLAEWSTRR